MNKSMNKDRLRKQTDKRPNRLRKQIEFYFLSLMGVIRNFEFYSLRS